MFSLKISQVVTCSMSIVYARPVLVVRHERSGPCVADGNHFAKLFHCKGPYYSTDDYVVQQYVRHVCSCHEERVPCVSASVVFL